MQVGFVLSSLFGHLSFWQFSRLSNDLKSLLILDDTIQSYVRREASEVGSTWGGVFMGFGLFLLLISLGEVYLITQSGGYITSYTKEVKDLYELTHLIEYAKVMSASNQLAPNLGRIGEALTLTGFIWHGSGDETGFHFIPEETGTRMVSDTSWTSSAIIPIALAFGMSSIVLGFLWWLVSDVKAD